MRKQNRSCGEHATAKSRYHFGAAKIINSKKSHRNADDDNKRGYSAEGYSLLTSALRPRLFGAKNCKSKSILFSTVKNKLSNNSALRFPRENLTFMVPILSITILAISSLFWNNANVSAVSATLSVPEGISVNANPSVNNGFAESSNGAISVSTGNQMGYTLTIKAKDNNQLKNGSNVLNSISTNLTADQYKNGDYVNTWGMKPSSINSVDNTSYVPGPTTSGITIAQTNMNSTTAENYSLGIAAKVNSNTVAGNYGNTFVLTATANEARYNITFNKNGGTGGPSTGASNYTQSGDIGSSTTVTIASGTPTYSNKEFLGWCTENPGTGDTCNGALIQPGGKFPLCKCDLNITLYAMYGTRSGSGGGGDTGGDFSGVTDGNFCQYNSYLGRVYDHKCYMWADFRTQADWDTARNACTSIGWRIPTKDEYQTLINKVGSGAQLYNAGWNGDYWSSTIYTSGHPYLSVNSSSASINGGNYGVSRTCSVRCIAG